MTNFSRNLIAIALVLFLGTTSAFAQVTVEANAGYAWQQGSFLAPCGCTFGQGSGVAVNATVGYDLISLAGIAVGAKTGIDYQSYSSSEVAPANTSALISGGDIQDIKLTYWRIAPYLRVEIPITHLVLQLSPGLDYLVSSKFHHEAGAKADADELAMNPDTTIDIRKDRYFVDLGIGYEVSLAGLSITPAITYELPLTVVRDAQSVNWKVNILSAGVGIRF